MLFAQSQPKHWLWEKSLFVPITPRMISSSSSRIAELMMMATVSLKPHKNMEATLAYLHYVALGFETTRRAFGAAPGSLYPDEEQCKELGLFTLIGRVGSKKDN
ncbi:hypothetical protein PVK06_044012 [Gossypium arboreum]|uniref:Uncharacterized protein n=1 Tax=Gossypium arboreum TaxID=29729 RepID=A0ABR0MQ09_GOSAR|nr:hypothetical protein PVK06_044012 [Gossypium arboreum]